MKTVSYRTYQQTLSKLQREVSPERHIYVYDMGNGFDEPVQLGVNWAALGTVPADEAREFAEKLVKAATAAENFEYNGYTVTYGED